MINQLPEKHLELDIVFKGEQVKFNFGELKSKKLSLSNIEETMDTVSSLLFYFGNLEAKIIKMIDSFELKLKHKKLSLMTKLDDGKKSDKALERLIASKYSDKMQEQEQKLISLRSKRRMVTRAKETMKNKSEMLRSIGSIRKMLSESTEKKDFNDNKD